MTQFSAQNEVEIIVFQGNLKVNTVIQFPVLNMVKQIVILA